MNRLALRHRGPKGLPKEVVDKINAAEARPSEDRP